MQPRKFVADWKNGFEFLYLDDGVVKDVERNAKQFFLHHLKQFIDKEILGDYVNAIEEYGWIDGKYVKLSDRLIEAVQTDVKECIKKMQNANDDYVRQIEESRDLYYSKKLHGDKMLRNIQPEFVANKCKIYFAYFYNKLFTSVIQIVYQHTYYITNRILPEFPDNKCPEVGSILSFIIFYNSSSDIEKSQSGHFQNPSPDGKSPESS